MGSGNKVRMALQRPLWLIAKFLQGLGLCEVLYGLYLGIAEGDMAQELRFVGVGILLFAVGWFIEKGVSR